MLLCSAGSMAPPTSRSRQWPTALRALPAQIESLRSYAVGPDLQLGEGRGDFAVVAEFDDADGYQAYVDHPAHQAVANDLIAPIRADRAHVQFAI